MAVQPVVVLLTINWARVFPGASHFSRLRTQPSYVSRTAPVRPPRICDSPELSTTESAAGVERF
ncbi:hypothetical protein HanPI659440_Chr00c02g0708431 [Helianthus annuus]|nr:hypothetical protein HanPI659440_Chr00c02g0708421 [Helianthus annuus]KAJ0818443.1 hypothetical protein HanPI659440_Chr00c02g0708431 [Helianthus annuus]